MKKVVSEISGVVFSLPWLVAKDEGLFEAEGIDMEFVRALNSGRVSPTENHAEVNPILGHVAFEDAQVPFRQSTGRRPLARRARASPNNMRRDRHRSWPRLPFR